MVLIFVLWAAGCLSLSYCTGFWDCHSASAPVLQPLSSVGPAVPPVSAEEKADSAGGRSQVRTGFMPVRRTRVGPLYGEKRRETNLQACACVRDKLNSYSSLMVTPILIEFEVFGEMLLCFLKCGILTSQLCHFYQYKE